MQIRPGADQWSLSCKTDPEAKLRPARLPSARPLARSPAGRPSAAGLLSDHRGRRPFADQSSPIRLA
jgi:hypothetical protein